MSDQEQAPEERQSEEEIKKGSDEEEQIVPKKKKRIEQIRLKPENLTDTKKGVLYLYNLTKDYNFRNDELEELDRYMHVIEEWHYQIMPKYDFDYFTNRLQKIGGNNSVQTHLQFLRKAHKGLIPWQFVTNPLDNLETNPNQTKIVNPNQTEINQEAQANIIQEEIPQTNHKEVYEKLLSSIPSGVKDIPPDIRKPMKLALRKNGPQASEKKNLKVRFQEEPILIPTPPVQQVDDDFDEQLFAQLELAAKLKADKQDQQQ